jgi:pyridoxal phosphate enzyme (YggS family)
VDDWLQELSENLARVSERMEAARARRRTPDGDVKLLAATKGVDAATLRQVVALGITRFGESYMQEAVDKMPWTAGVAVEWHLIGHLQTNKAQRALGSFDVIESVDRMALAELLSQRAVAARMVQPAYIQVNLGREPQKHGFSPERVVDAALAIAALPGLRLHGMMALAPQLSQEDVRPHYAEGRILFDDLRGRLGPDFATLSMGMSADYEVAIEEGSTMVRLGTALFGPRPTG